MRINVDIINRRTKYVKTILYMFLKKNLLPVSDLIDLLVTDCVILLINVHTSGNSPELPGKERFWCLQSRGVCVGYLKGTFKVRS